MSLAQQRVPALVTARLLLQPLALDDAPQVQRLFPHWEIVRYLADVVPWPYPADGAYTFICNSVLPARERGMEWTWSLRLREDPASLVGVIALVAGEQDHRGFWLGSPWQGRGLMLEAVAAANDFWFDVLGEPILRVQKAAANVRSSAISRNTGMTLVGYAEKNFVSGRLPVELWEQTAVQWRQHRLRAMPATEPDAVNPGCTT